MKFNNGDVVTNKHHPGTYYLVVYIGRSIEWPAHCHEPNCVLIRLNQLDHLKSTRPDVLVCNLIWPENKGKSWVRREHLAAAGFVQTGVNLHDVLGNIAKKENV